jgi:hypothetical protein
MTTGNVQTDPYIAAAPGQANVTSTIVGVKNLQSVHLTSPGPVTLPLGATANGVSPDAIEIAGNLTTSDQFDVAAMPLAPAGQALSGCVKISLSPHSPAMYRLLGGDVTATGAASELQNAFQPDASTQFLIRLVDDSGRSQYLATCNGAGGTATGVDGNGWPYVMVDADQTPIRTASSTGTVGGLSGLASGRAWVNPVQVVRWEITYAGAPTHPEPAQFALAGSDGDGGVDPAKYDLVRTVLDYKQQATALSEVVAEYAVDLKFAFNVDTSLAALPGTQPTPNLVAYAFDDANNGATAAQVTTAPPPRPQRIRSIRVRLSTRAAQPDRTSKIAPQPAYVDTYKYRYCVLPSSSGTCPDPPDNVARWARVRTVTTEVALPNQAKSFY